MDLITFGHGIDATGRITKFLVRPCPYIQNSLKAKIHIICLLKMLLKQIKLLYLRKG